MRLRVNKELRKSNLLNEFGFRMSSTTSHTSRTIMLAELEILFTQTKNKKSSLQNYQLLIVDYNCLHKSSFISRELTLRDLKSLYGLDDSITLFRVLKLLWGKDPQSLPILAFSCAYCRDSLLRASQSFVLKYPERALLARQDLEKFLSQTFPNRFSSKTLCSVSQNINSSWTQAGYLKGRVKKIRTRINPSVVSVVYVLLLGFLSGYRGTALFETEFTELLDSSKETLIMLAEDASRQGLIYMKRLGNVIDIDFSKLLLKEEMETLYDQD